jgi:hypothetical protein
MYRPHKVALPKDRSHKYTLYEEDQQLQYSDFLDLLQHDQDFRTFFIQLLSDIPFRAYHWETPPVTSETLYQPFEFVITNTPVIDLPPNPGPFRQYFKADSPIAVFNNLGNDAKLIAPAPRGQGLNYSHIGVFTDEAPLEHQHALWQTVGQVTEEQVSDQPTWLNTAGGGVAWLHVRLDSAPKYYRHRPYTEK